MVLAFTCLYVTLETYLVLLDGFYKLIDLEVGDKCCHGNYVINVVMEIRY